ncbi:hypothetical protein FM107_13915 [Sphingobacterium sp. JB170]|nr:hypothetical protein FM107_13915 [Sphingobacterium sp. JB170]
MWTTYSEKWGRVVIKSSFRKLRDSIIDKRNVYIHPIQYYFPNIKLGNIH